MRREETLTTREEKARIFEKALTQVSAALDAERAKAKATHQEYLDMIQAHTDHGKQVLDLDKMLGERMVELDGREHDLELRAAALAEAYAWDNHDELMEFIELCKLLHDTKMDRIVKANRLETMVRGVSKVLEDLGMSPIPEIPRDRCMADDV
jgi:hypothetical protein